MYCLLLLNFIVPFVMILVASILKKKPVEDMKSSNGYNTPTSRKSQAHWDYAQKIAPDIFMLLGKTLGIIEIVISIGLFLLQVPSNRILIVGGSIGAGFMFLGFLKTDSEIKKRFEER